MPSTKTMSFNALIKRKMNCRIRESIPRLETVVSPTEGFAKNSQQTIQKAGSTNNNWAVHYWRREINRYD